MFLLHFQLELQVEDPLLLPFRLKHTMFGYARDANASVDLSMLGGGGDINTTARLGEARKSLSSSQIGRGSFVRGGGGGGGGPASAKKSMFGAGRPSIALQGGDKCVGAAIKSRALRARRVKGPRSRWCGAAAVGPAAPALRASARPPLNLPPPSNPAHFPPPPPPLPFPFTGA